jgi:transposase
MITDQQVRRLMKFIKKDKSIATAASKAGMDEKTARKYLKSGKLPSQIAKEHNWRTRSDPFDGVWDEAAKYLEANPHLEAKTLFEFIQKNSPGKYSDGQIRTFQRKVKEWRATCGPSKEVFFAQYHEPGKLCQSDFTHMSDLGVTISGLPFPHLAYHFVLTYSNYEDANICFSESYESLSEGLQNALWKLGGVPETHRTDRLSAAVNKECNADEFTRAYQEILDHYGMIGAKTSAGRANEIGDVEQRHFRFKKALEQALILRGSRDFESREDYRRFVDRLLSQLNAGRHEKIQQDLAALKALPDRRLDDAKKLTVKVSKGSTIHVLHNTYSVDSRLIGEYVNIKAHAERLEIYYAQKHIDSIPRMRGEGKHLINYRHIIDWLSRKPGAFEQYRYRDDLFPSSIFRMAYDSLVRHNPNTANKKYLEILSLSAKESEAGVEDALYHLLDDNNLISTEAVKAILEAKAPVSISTDVAIDEIDLSIYDAFLSLERV